MRAKFKHADLLHQAVKPVTTTKVLSVAAAASKPAIQTTKSIVINTSNPQQPQTIKTNTITQQPVVRKEPRVIRVTPEQFAAIKAGKGTRLTGIGGATSAGPAVAKPVIAKAIPPQKTIKIVRLNPNGATSTSNVQLMPKPVILSSPKAATPATVSVSTSGGLAASSSSGSGSQKEAMMKKLKEIQDAREALMKKEEEIMRQLGT